MKILTYLFIIQISSVVLSVIKLIKVRTMINVLRFSYGPFLIFSGFVKTVDPIGFSYKLQEYFEVFGMLWLNDFTLILSIIICTFEIMLGFLLILGSYTKTVLVLNLLMMLGFTFLTFFSAYFNVVTDCGCFGDFMKLDPWFSFQKDIVFVIVSSVLLYYRHLISPILDESKTKYSILIALIIFLFFPIYGISKLPLIDFRPYKVGSNIGELRKLPSDAKLDVYDDIWYYELDGKTTEYKTEEKPWDIEGAEFVDRKTVLVQKGDEPKIKDFNIVSDLNKNDITDSVLSLDYVALVIIYDFDKSNSKGVELVDNSINELSNIGIPSLTLSSSNFLNDKILDKSKQISEAYNVDQTTLKTMIRSNPGIILLNKGTVISKFHWRDAPNNWDEYIN